MKKVFETLFGGHIEWHTDPKDLPPYNRRDNIIVAYAYHNRNGNESIADRVCFSTGDLYLKSDNRTYLIAWSYFNNTTTDEILRKIIAKRDQYEKDHAEEIKLLRIASLEEELKQLKNS